MKAKINATLLKSNAVKPLMKPFEISDTELKGFILRIQPNWIDKAGIEQEGTKTYIIRYRLPNGKQNRTVIGRHTDLTPTQARDKAEKIRRDVKDGIPPKKPASIVCTLQTFLDDDYTPWAETNRKDGKATIKRLKTCFPDFLNLPLPEITALAVEKWRSCRLKDGIQASTCNRDLTALKALISKAVEWNRLDAHTLTKVKPSKVDSVAKVRFLADCEKKSLLLSLDDRERLIKTERAAANTWRKERGYSLYQDLYAVAYADHLKPMILVSLNTGIRWGELVSLTWENIDMEKEILTVIGDTAKSGKTRHIPLNSIALDALKEWKKQSDGTLVFPGRDEGKTLDNVNKSWKSVLAVAGINNFRWHDMRHHFASWLVMGGVDLNTVRELLGHSDLKMTLRYAHLAPEHKAAAVAILVKS
jgi:integrase